MLSAPISYQLVSFIMQASRVIAQSFQPLVCMILPLRFNSEGTLKNNLFSLSDFLPFIYFSMHVSHMLNIKQENKDVYHLEHRCTYQAASENKTIHLKGFDSLLSAHTLFDSLMWHLESTHACMQLGMEMFSWLLHVVNFLPWLHLKFLGTGALLSVLRWGRMGRGWEKSEGW